MVYAYLESIKRTHCTFIVSVESRWRVGS